MHGSSPFCFELRSMHFLLLLSPKHRNARQRQLKRKTKKSNTGCMYCRKDCNLDMVNNILLLDHQWPREGIINSLKQRTVSLPDQYLDLHCLTLD
jgi:hypothetical protein